VIQRDLELRCSHSLVRRHEALGEEIATRIVGVQHDAAVAIVLSDVVTERVQSFGDVSGRCKYG
jgi:hypothetical protein